MKEQYRRANDQIPVNQELLTALKEKAAAPMPKRVRPMRQAGLVMAAVLLGVTLFSLSDLQQIRPQPSPGILGSGQEQSGFPLKKEETIPSSDRDQTQTAEHQTEQQTTKIPSTAKAPSGQSHQESEATQQIAQPEQETKRIEKIDSIDPPATASARIVADDQTPQENAESVVSLSAVPTPEPDDSSSSDRMSPIASSETTDALVDPSSGGSGGGMQTPVKMPVDNDPANKVPVEEAVDNNSSPTPTPNSGTATVSVTQCPALESEEEPTPSPTPTPSPQPSPSEDSEEK